MNRLGLVTMIAVAIILMACGGEAALDPLEVGDPERGREIFETGTELSREYCVHCHSLDESPIEGGPSLMGISGVAGSRVEGLSSEDYLRQSIIEPSAYIVDGYGNTMEQFYGDLLTEDEINDLIAFLLTQ